jgi:hypothetical protein
VCVDGGGGGGNWSKMCENINEYTLQFKTNLTVNMK